MAKRKTYSRGINAGNPERAWAHRARSCSQSESRLRFIITAHGFSDIISMCDQMVTSEIIP